MEHELEAAERDTDAEIVEVEAVVEPADEREPWSRPGRSRRRSLGVIGAATSAVVLASMGVVELVGAHRVIDSLSVEVAGKGEERRDGAVLAGLRDVQVEFGWTIAGRRARVVERRMFELRLERLAGYLGVDAPGRTVRGLLGLREWVEDRSDLARIDGLLRRATAEMPAARAFRAVQVAHPSRQALREFGELVGPELLEFYLARVERPGVLPHVREKILEALRRLNDPRAIGAVGRVYVRTPDAGVRVIAAEVLRAAKAFREGADAGSWRAGVEVIRGLADRDGGGGERERRVTEALRWLGASGEGR